MKNWENRNEFYTIKNSVLEKPSIWVKIRCDWTMKNLNGGRDFYIFMNSIGDGIFREDTFELKDMGLIVFLTQEDKDRINQEFSLPLERMNEFKLAQCAMKILNKFPHLRTSTCIGWEDYDDKTKNSNWMGGEYIFPDNNTYLVCLYKGKLRVYPGTGDAFGTWINREPLTEVEINLNEWVEKYDNKKDVEITIVNDGNNTEMP